MVNATTFADLGLGNTSRLLPDEIFTNSSGGGSDASFMATVLPRTVLMVVVSIIGIPGNSLVLYMYGMKKHTDAKATTAIFIIALASIDLFTCAIVNPWDTFHKFTNFRYMTDVECKLNGFIRLCSLLSSMFVLVGIAIDRYFHICKPWNTSFTVIYAKFYTAGSLAAGFVVSSPNIYVFAIGRVGTVDYCSPTEEKQIIGLVCSATECGIYIGCVCTLVILYYQIYLTVHRTDKKRKAMKARPTASGISHPPPPSDMVSSAGDSCTMDGESKDPLLNKGVDGQKPNGSLNSKDTVVVIAGQQSRTRLSSNAGPAPRMKRKGSKKTQSLRGKTARMLVLATVVFCLAWLPYWIITHWENIDSDYFNHRSLVELAFLHIFASSFYMLSAANPMIYTFTNSRFRADVWKAMTRAIRS